VLVAALVAALALSACTDEPSSSDTTAAEGALSGGPTTTPTTDSVDASTSAVPQRALDRVRPPEANTVAEVLALRRPVVIAHAGGDFEAPHSTMYAFTEAALAGADVLEMDVMLSADRQLMVQHDDTVDRTTEATGRVRDLSAAELDALDNAHWFAGDTWSDQTLDPSAYLLRGVRTGERPAPEGYGPDDFRIETFRSVATAFPDHVLDVEIKIPTGDDGQPDTAWAIEGAEVLAAEIAELGRTDSVIVVSFDDDVVAAFRAAAPTVATSPGLGTLVTWYGGTPVEFAPTDVVVQVPPFYAGVEVLTADVIARAQAEGFDVWVWMDDTSTQENADFYVTMLDRGVDGLLVSRPTVAVDVVTGRAS
jgi:glycerophosphoryl diester phosphodiesterase